MKMQPFNDMVTCVHNFIFLHFLTCLLRSELGEKLGGSAPFQYFVTPALWSNMESKFSVSLSSECVQTSFHENWEVAKVG